MDESEKMTALKKVYAEIILNTAKEAAGRIMVSERKTQQAQHDLASSKQEALRLLLRLKQTMDSKLNDAETKSVHQQRRIEELEAQLQEGEDVVSNLRAELNKVHMRLEVMEKNRMQCRANIMEKTVCEDGFGENKNELPETILASQEKGLSDPANRNFVANNSLKECSYVAVPSIIRRGKKPDLYRNRCTQRIHAYDGHPLNGHFSLSSELDDAKNEKIIREDKEGEKICMMPPTAAEITHDVGKEIDVIDSNNVHETSSKDQGFKSFRRKRKRAVRHKRINISVLKSAAPVTNEALSELSTSPTCPSDSHDTLENFNHEDIATQSQSHLTALPNVSDIGTMSEPMALVQGNDEFADACSNVIDDDREVVSSLVLIRHQSGSGGCLSVPSSNPELDMKDVLSMNLDAKMVDTAKGFANPPPRDRVLKYTFQRKRRKENLSSDDSCLLPENNPLKLKKVKTQNGSLEPQNSTTIVEAESSRDSRRMAQVARQLISLSEKKWWSGNR